MKLPQNKHQLRQQMKRLRQNLSSAERKAQNHAIAQRVLSDPAFLQAKTVFCYCSTAQEIDTYPILQAALSQKKQLCLPRTLPLGQMEARQIFHLEQLQPASYGILEPGCDSPLIAPEEIDLCIIPCLAADLNGHRLGYGGGYYDRFLPRTHATHMVLCAQARLFSQIPSQEHDITCDIILTESQVIRFHEK